MPTTYAMLPVFRCFGTIPSGRTEPLLVPTLEEEGTLWFPILGAPTGTFPTDGICVYPGGTPPAHYYDSGTPCGGCPPITPVPIPAPAPVPVPIPPTGSTSWFYNRRTVALNTAGIGDSGNPLLYNISQ